jgi:hypothetical protein
MRRELTILALILTLVLACVVTGRPALQGAEPTVIPLSGHPPHHVKVRINNSDPLWLSLTPATRSPSLTMERAKSWGYRFKAKSM